MKKLKSNTNITHINVKGLRNINNYISEKIEIIEEDKGILGVKLRFNSFSEMMFDCINMLNIVEGIVLDASLDQNEQNNRIASIVRIAKQLIPADEMELIDGLILFDSLGEKKEFTPIDNIIGSTY